MIDKKRIEQLIQEARQAQKNAYAPYSRFTVGAAVLGIDGNVYKGCNVENASYGLTICAERNAMFHGAACGCYEFPWLAIVGDSQDYTLPCGACRQVMAEFHVQHVILTKPDNTYTIVSLQQLLPYCFELESGGIHGEEI